MSYLGVTDPDHWEVPMPEVTKLCAVCGVTDEEVLDGRVVVSPSGCAHHSDYENTACGHDATGDGWWWPL